MIRGHMALVGAVAVALIAGLGVAGDPKAHQLPDKAKAILDRAEQLELFSLDPELDRKAGKDGFHGWKVLGQTVVKDAPARKQVVGSLYNGIAENTGNGAKCFDPRHGVRATVEGKTVDLVICFECSWVYVYYDREGDRQGVAITTGKPQAVFDKVLKDAGVPLPKQAPR